MDKQNIQQIDKYIFDKNQKLGVGSFGTVYKGYHSEHQAQYAIKEQKDPGFSKDQKKQTEIIIREIQILQSLKHQNIVAFIDAKKTEDYFYTIMEFCNQGTLTNFIKQNKMVEHEIMGYFAQVVEAFKYLQQFQKPIIHRDIKPDNILLHNNQIKISDFGQAKFFNKNESDHTISVGTQAYQSPQIQEAQPYTTLTDMWSLGVMLYELIFGQIPWLQSKKMNAYQVYEKQKEMLKKGQIEFPMKVQQRTEYLLRNMLQIEEQDRLQWNQLFEIFSPKFDRISAIHDDIDELQNQLIRQNQIVFKNNLIKQEEVTESTIQLHQSIVKINESQLNQKIQQNFQYFEKKDQLVTQANQCKERYDYEVGICLFLFNIIKKLIKYDKSQEAIGILTQRIYIHISLLHDSLENQQNYLDEKYFQEFLELQEPNLYEQSKQQIQQVYQIYSNNYKQIIKKSNENNFSIKQFEEILSKFLLESTQFKQSNDLLYLQDDILIALTLKQSFQYSKKINISRFYQNRRYFSYDDLQKRVDKGIIWVKQILSQ